MMRIHFLVLASIILTLKAQAGTPACQYVFVNKSMAPQSLESVVTELAAMKLSLDEARARGEMSLSQRSLESAFSQRYRELVIQESPRTHETELRELIRQKVLKLQNKVSEELIAKEEHNEAVRNSIAMSEFSTERMDVEARGHLQYSADNVVIHGLNSFGIKDIKTGFYKKFDWVPLTSHVHGDFVYVLSQEGFLLKVDMKNDFRAETMGRHLNQEFNLRVTDFSPSGHWFAMLRDDGRIEFMNLQQSYKANWKVEVLKKKIYFQKLFSTGEAIRRIKFVSDDQLFIFTNEHRLIKLDLNTLALDQIDLGPKFNPPLTEVHFLGDDTVAIQHGNNFAVVKIADLTDFQAKSQFQELPIVIDKIVPANTDSYFVSSFGDANIYEIRRSNMRLTPIPIFEGDQHGTLGLASDPVTQRVFISASDDSVHGGKPYLEIIKFNK